MDIPDLPIEHLGDPAYICGGGALIIHVVTLILSVLLSLYGLYCLARHAGSISKNERLLLVASCIIAFIPISDLLAHWRMLPGEAFWRTIHILSGVVGLYFTYRFAMVMDAKEAESDRKIFMELLTAILFSIAFYLITALFESTIPILFVLSYAALGIVLLWLIALVLRIIQKTKFGGGQAFSLRSFSLSMIPLVSLSILGLALVQIPSVIMFAVLKMSPLNPVLMMLLGAQGSFYMIIGMLMAAFGYVVLEISAFYGPIGKFLEAKNKKGRMRI